MKRIIVTGSKILCDIDALRGTLRRILNEYKFIEIITIAPYGAGQIAAEWARHNRISVREVQLPTWKLNNSKFCEEYQARHSEMIKAADNRPDLILLYPGNGITCDLAKQAKAAGIPIMEMVK
jgi:hypothetical protein